MRIHHKFMVFFVIILCAMSAVTWIIYSNSKQTTEQYDQILDRFLVLNEISQHTAHANQLFENYLMIQNESQLTALQNRQVQLLSMQSQFAEVMASEENSSLYKNFYHMLAYFNHEVNAAIETQDSERTSEHFLHREEVEKISSWLNDTTLQLINEELGDYHDMHADVLEEREFHQLLALNGAGAFFIVSIIVTYFMSKRILRPVQALIYQSSEISAGNFDVKDVRVTNDEVGVLSQTFNQMKHNVDQLIKEMRHRAQLERKVKNQEIEHLETKRLLKEMELKSLQNQMNPHFLFNTLNTVAKLSYIEGAAQSSGLIVSISKLLRYNLQPIESQVTLEAELNHVNKYIEIQQTRFGERIKVNTFIETNHLDVRLPVLTLQPIVENAFIHGLDALEDGGRITIHVFEKENSVFIKVEDSGAGIPEETLKMLRTPEQSAAREKVQGHLTGIGLKNVQKRLSLLFDKDNLVTINSQVNKGTAVILEIPLHKKGSVQIEA
ncbi:sensor histidine kinase [Alkalicoccus daliensis]|uniref:histidine kinase n=1 Tax=Alkalicoccus daliensis TaxID=745820 RepID=A0A1H0GZM5_9BACI|nr:sensor histidine kinase [Alkalicoccus daliensis]SDO12328.1 Histidine kinase-, DNA gyrase B-, and HSP90-like ATPase [Alkalicoccus daliensis]